MSPILFFWEHSIGKQSSNDIDIPFTEILPPCAERGPGDFIWMQTCVCVCFDKRAFADILGPPLRAWRMPDAFYSDVSHPLHHNAVSEAKDWWALFSTAHTISPLRGKLLGQITVDGARGSTTFGDIRPTSLPQSLWIATVLCLVEHWLNWATVAVREGIPPMCIY